MDEAIHYFCGRLARDPVAFPNKQGNPALNVAKFTIMVNQRWTKSDGTKGERVDAYPVTAFGKMADVITKWGRKGKEIGIHGSFRNDGYRDENNNWVDRMTFVARRIRLGPDSAATRSQVSNTPAPAAGSPFIPTTPAADEDQTLTELQQKLADLKAAVAAMQK